MNSYDLVPYASRPLAEVQCRVLETIAVMFGMSPAPPASARVLELGCGTGENLAAQALEYPAARFTGCDSSSVAIAAGRELIDALGLRNVELRHQDLRELNGREGDFDYILCHGVYSWVEPDVRARILRVFRQCLGPQGVGYLSYNTYPGWHLRGVARELIRSHAGRISDPQQAVAQALEILGVAAETTPQDSAIGTLFRQEYFDLSCAPAGYLYHEMLGVHNEPCYFREFFGHLQAAGLQYLGEAEFARNFSDNLPPKVRACLEGIPFLQREQLYDHLKGTAFRCSLLCGREIALDRHVDFRKLSRFSLSLDSETRVKSTPNESGLSDDGGLRLLSDTFELSIVTDPLTVAAIRCLQDQQPGFVSVQELQRAARENLSRLSDRSNSRRNDNTDQMMRFLQAAVTVGAVNLHLSPPRIACRVSRCPVVSPLLRLQAQRDRVVMNQLQQPLCLSAASRFLAGLLDGTRDHQQLAEMLEQEVTAGRIVRSPWEQEEDPEKLVHQVLAELCRCGLLVA